ncbi:MAG: sigma-70 family RNA polymerase sigma factor [Lachnospiraceae bacterium]|nr:sigma-70 family RNA polymerase sigma factor [Lachnospiraceae bacterium]
MLRLLKNPGEEIFDENVLYYIGGADVLPPPLEPKREEEMIRLLTTDRAPWARQTLIEHNLRLVVYIAKRFDNTGVGVEDLISIGTIGLLKSINTYKADKNIKLATYASRCIENEILMYLRRTSKNRAEVSIDEPLNTDFDGNELLLGDILGTDEDVISQNLEREAEHHLLCRSIERLSKREKTIVCLRFGLRLEPEKGGESQVYPVEEGKEMTQKEVAALLGISQSYISRLEKKIMLRLRKEMLKES